MALVISASDFVFAVYLYLQDDLGYDLAAYNYVPVIAIFCQYFGVAAGFVSAAHIVCNEIFSINTKTAGIVIVMFFEYISSFIALNLYTILLAVDTCLPFLLLSALNLLSAFLTYAFVPETSGKPLAETAIN